MSAKQLDRRDFRGTVNFLPHKPDTRPWHQQQIIDPGGKTFPERLSVRKRAIGWAKFRAYMLQAILGVTFAKGCSVAGTARPRPESERDVDIYTIIFLALAVFIFLRLRNVLGQRTGAERPPYDRATRDIVHGAQDNNVVPMPGKAIDQVPLAPTADVAPPTDRWKGLAEAGTPLALGLDAIATQDSSFDPQHFISGARSAYEMIVLAFANGDRRALKDLLSSEVYESFDAVIKDREKHEQKTETRFVSIDKAELVNAEARDRAAQLTVRFVSQMISVTRDKAGAIVDGNPEKVSDITDVWTFARDITSRDPNWKLVGTGSTQ
jgi:predicted lipid-binding transport protein (Tim44 family)